MPCKGIATKWAGDCGTSTHSCASQNKDDFSSEEWMYMPSQSACAAVKRALRNPAIKQYVLDVQAKTVVAVKKKKPF